MPNFQQAIALIRNLQIGTLLLSAAFIFLSEKPVKACAIPQRRSIILEQAPTKLNKATFMAKIEITRFTKLEYFFLMRGVIEESQTHPSRVGEKVTFIHDATDTIDSFCPMDIYAGIDGYVIGRVMKFNTNALIVDPYVADDWMKPIEDRIIEIDKDKFPLQDFYQ